MPWAKASRGKVDVRILAASNHDLRQMAGAGHFRQDLYYRLNVAPLHVPALRDRKEDIPLLVRFFMERICTRLRQAATCIRKRACLRN